MVFFIVILTVVWGFDLRVIRGGFGSGMGLNGGGLLHLTWAFIFIGLDKWLVW